MKISGWGRYPVVEGREVLSEDLERSTGKARLSRGLGRAYGDSALPPAAGETLAGTRLADRLLAFDPATGVLRAEAGLSLARLQDLFLHRGWSSPVAPGTEFVTVGGMVAADVHGKNHHCKGSFGEHVRSLRMRVADGRVLEVSEASEPELFRATLGGMGLTGHILEVEFALERIPSPWIWQESLRVGNLDALISALVESGREWPFTMSWLDCLAGGSSMGRGIVSRGRWAEPDEARARPPRRPFSPTLPFDLPSWLLSRLSMGLFNTGVYRAHGRRLRRGIMHPLRFFHPLDIVQQWNRAYGRRGMTQYQSVLPTDPSGQSYRRFFEVLAGSGEGSFLCVVKDFGPEGRGTLSFPRPGITASVDVPVRGERTARLIDALNEVVLEAGGRVYLAKDAFTRPEHLRAMEGSRLETFQQIRRKWDPEGHLASAQSVRLLGDRG
ncbi:MAG: FAD-binding oxidoreductase [Myxococcota bacterium]